MKKKFRKLRVDAHLTQEELANELGITQSLISNLERGARKIDDYIITLYTNYFKKDGNYFMDIPKPLRISEEDIASLDEAELVELLHLVTKFIYKKKK